MHTIDLPILLRYLDVRQHYYQFLQLLFFQPLQKDTVFELKNNETLASLNEIELGGHQLYQFFTHVTEDALEKEKDEFNRLFVGPGEILAPPWESVYTSREQLLFDKATFQVRDLYHQFGLQYVKENNEPDDHIAVELEFMIHLAGMTKLTADDLGGDTCPAKTENLEKLMESQADFLKSHLGVWVPEFCENIIKHSNSLLYIGAALLLKEFIESETESLQEIKEALANVR